MLSASPESYAYRLGNFTLLLISVVYEVVYIYGLVSTAYDVNYDVGCT